MRRLAVLACMTLMTACTADIGPDEVGELGTLEINHIPVNGIVFFPPALAAFKTTRLASQSFDPVTGHPDLKNLPFDSETRKFLKYTVECALRPEQSVRFRSDIYHGMLGECPSWNRRPPSTDCLEAVSGCLLARQNPMGLRVRFNGRGLLGEGGFLDSNLPAPADTYEEDFLGTKISSFWTSCNGTSGELRNCGWNAVTAFTGTCTPGAPVSIGAGAKVGDCNNPLGSALLGDMALRACEGMSGCNSTSATHLGSNDNACGKNPALDFVCPASGVFSAMLSGRKAGALFTGTIGALSGPPVKYPVDIIDLFTVLEAVYYGNMFDKLNPNVTFEPRGGPNEGGILRISDEFDDHTGFKDPQIFPVEDTWCCYDPEYPADYLDNGRMCAVIPVLDPGGNLAEANLCMCQSLGACNTVEKDSKANLCTIWDQIPFLGDVDHDDCLDGNGVPRRWPMTVFLHDSCDMVGEEGRDLCVRK